MKNFILGLLIAIFTFNSYAQKINKHAIGIDANYLSLINKNEPNNFNYGFSILFSEKIARIKVSIGVEYSDMNYFFSGQNNSQVPQLYKEEYKTKYLNIPFLVSFIRNSEKRFKIDPYIGIISTSVLDYDVIQHEPNHPPISVKNSDADPYRGLAFRIGINLSRPIGQHLVLNASPYITGTLRENFDVNNKYLNNVPANNSTIGIKMGLEYGW